MPTYVTIYDSRRFVRSDSTDVTIVLPETAGGTNQSTYATGDLLYASAANTLSKLAGNTTVTKKFLRETGSGAAATAPAWDTLASGDIPNNAADTSGTAAHVTTNANLTGPITSVGNATSVASQTGTGTKFVMSVDPTIGGGGTGTTPSTLIVDSGSGAGGFAFLPLKRNSTEKGSLAIASANGEFTPLSVANDTILRAAQKLNISADGGTTDHVSLLGTTGRLAMLKGAFQLKGFTVATLPTGVQGDIAFCTDLLAPTFGAAAVGGGAVVGLVFYTGAAWVTA